MWNAYSTSIISRDVVSLVLKNITTKTCLPPLVHKQPGRPKNSRIKSYFDKVIEKLT